MHFDNFQVPRLLDVPYQVSQRPFAHRLHVALLLFCVKLLQGDVSLQEVLGVKFLGVGKFVNFWLSEEIFGHFLV